MVTRIKHKKPKRITAAQWFDEVIHHEPRTRKVPSKPVAPLHRAELEPAADKLPAGVQKLVDAIENGPAVVGPILAPTPVAAVPDHLRVVYTPPFKHDGMFEGMYISDYYGHTVGDMNGDLETGKVKQFRARGYGRFKYMTDGDRLHDEMEAFFKTIIDDDDDANVAVIKLNAAWGHT